MHKLTVDQYIGYCWEVVAWNKVSRGDHDFSASATLKQLDYCLEEILETVKGYEDNNLVEILDGLADSMVTLSYLMFLIKEGEKGCFDDYGLGYWSDSASNRYTGFHSIMEMNYLRLKERPTSHEVEAALGDVLAALNDLSDKANIAGVVEEVLDSNWSKFPYLDQVIPMEECKWIEENRGKEGVYHAVIGNKVVFRDKGGKIVKPSTFKEPDIQKHIYKDSSKVTASVSQEIKIGTIVQCLSGDSVGLVNEGLYEVEGLDEGASKSGKEVAYTLKELNSQISGFVMRESWVSKGLMSVLEGDVDDEYKVDISDQVAKVREKIALTQEPEVLDIKGCAVTRWDGKGNLEIVY